MTTPERLRRRRCIGLRVGMLFAVLLAAFNWRIWGIVAVAVAGGLLAFVVYWRDCRGSGPNSARRETHSGDLER
jgi:O-antigen/teichoic acid export membrane protein